MNYNPRYRANPDNWGHDEYQRAWTRRFWVAFAALTLGTGLFVPDMVWVIPLVPLTLLALVVVVCCAAAVILILFTGIPLFFNWLNGR